MASIHTLHVSDLSMLTMQVTVTRGFRIRLAIGKMLLRLAAWVMCCAIEFRSKRG